MTSTIWQEKIGPHYTHTATLPPVHPMKKQPVQLYEPHMGLRKPGRRKEEGQTTLCSHIRRLHETTTEPKASVQDLKSSYLCMRFHNKLSLLYHVFNRCKTKYLIASLHLKRSFVCLTDGIRCSAEYTKGKPSLQKRLKKKKTLPVVGIKPRSLGLRLSHCGIPTRSKQCGL